MQDQKIKAIGYVRVSSSRQEDNNRYNYQEQAIRREAERRNWDIEIVKEVRSGKNILKRPALKSILDKLEKKEASILVVACPDRLTRNVDDGAFILNKSKQEGWKIWPLNIQPEGLQPEYWVKTFRQAVLDATYELDVLSRRTKEGLEKAKQDGKLEGRHPTHSPESLHRIDYLKNKKKMTYAQITEILNKENYDTARPNFAKDSLWTIPKVAWAIRKIKEEKGKK